jgi:hypothetical protein
MIEIGLDERSEYLLLAVGELRLAKMEFDGWNFHDKRINYIAHHLATCAIYLIEFHRYLSEKDRAPATYDIVHMSELDDPSGSGSSPLDVLIPFAQQLSYWAERAHYSAASVAEQAEVKEVFSVLATLVQYFENALADRAKAKEIKKLDGF